MYGKPLCLVALCPISARREDRCPLYRNLNFSPRIGLKIHGWVLRISGMNITSPFWGVLSWGSGFWGFSGRCSQFVLTFVVFYTVCIDFCEVISLSIDFEVYSAFSDIELGLGFDFQ